MKYFPSCLLQRRIMIFRRIHQSEDSPLPLFLFHFLKKISFLWYPVLQRESLRDSGFTAELYLLTYEVVHTEWLSGQSHHSTYPLTLNLSYTLTGFDLQLIRIDPATENGGHIGTISVIWKWSGNEPTDFELRTITAWKYIDYASAYLISFNIDYLVFIQKVEYDRVRT